mgnify:CR=1 FL=1
MYKISSINAVGTAFDHMMLKGCEIDGVYVGDVTNITMNATFGSFTILEICVRMNPDSVSKTNEYGFMSDIMQVDGLSSSASSADEGLDDAINDIHKVKATNVGVECRGSE